MIVKTHAIVLRIIPFSETSRIVVWLSRDFGKITTIIKGSQRRNSRFVGQYDLFYTCELLFYLKTFQGLHVAKECSLLKMRASLRFRWKATACASYFSDLISIVAPDYAVHLELYHLLDAALNFFSNDIPTCAGMFWFELKLMQLMGVSPQFDACLKCRRSLKAENKSNGAQMRGVFSCMKGGGYCPECVPGDIPDAINAPPDVMGLLRFWQSAPSFRSAQASKCTDFQIGIAEKMLGRLLQYHMMLPLDGRLIAFDLLRRQVPSS